MRHPIVSQRTQDRFLSLALNRLHFVGNGLKEIDEQCEPNADPFLLLVSTQYPRSIHTKRSLFTGYIILAHG